ncbi:MAG: YceI family protein [Sphingobium sp.]
MRPLLPALACILLSAAPALAAPAPGWTVDKAQSRVAFTAAMNGQAFNGTFRRFDARILFDPANLAGSSVSATIDMASAVTGDQSRDESLPTADWFAVSSFPRATFVAKSFKAVGKGRFQAAGTLTIRNVSRPVVLPFQLAITGNAAAMQGALTIDRRWFGVGQGQFAGVESVAANVTVKIAIKATKAAK